MQLYTSPGFTEEWWAWSISPDLVIYRDGTVISQSIKAIEPGGDYTFTLSEGHLDTPELCALLVQVESDGFFDFDPAMYQAVDVTDSEFTEVAVRAWRQRAISNYALGFTIAEATTPSPEYELNPQVPEGLARTYTWLSSYVPPNAQPYTPKRVQLWIWIIPEEDSNGLSTAQWEVDGISLATLLAEHSPTDAWGVPSTLLEAEGEQAGQLWDALGTSRVGYYKEGTLGYIVAIRPLLPLESRGLVASGWDSAGDPQFPLTPSEPLDCTMEPLPPVRRGDIPPPP